MSTLAGLSRRERQIMDILYRRGKASASEVREFMENAPGYSAVALVGAAAVVGAMLAYLVARARRRSGSSTDST